jgi:hypothetical protein
MTAATLAGTDELDALLGEAGRRGFLVHMFRVDRRGPEVVASVFNWGGCSDVFVLSGTDHAQAYRMPTGPAADVFAPDHVVWWYRSSPVWTLRALLTLPEPGQPGAPVALSPAPPGLGVPGDRTPVRIRRRGR